ALLAGREEAGCEAGAVKHRPEAIAGACEVAADGGGVEAGVDAGEDDVEVAAEDVVERLSGRGLQFFGRGLEHGAGWASGRRASGERGASSGDQEGMRGRRFR